MQKASHTRIHFISLATFAVFLALLLTACGQDAYEGEGSTPPDYSKLTKDSPPPLAALYEKGNELVDGGQEAFDAQMAELKGHPAVVNVWASWCGPCRAEFPHFQDAAASMGGKVAFLGVDSNDDADAARTFLDENPLPYPSFSDQDMAIKDSLESGRGFPATAFFNSEGERTFTKQGQYASLDDLEADIREHAING